MTSESKRKGSLLLDRKVQLGSTLASEIVLYESEIHAAVSQDLDPNPSQREIRGAVLQTMLQRTSLSLPDILELQSTLRRVETRGSTHARISDIISRVVETVENW